MEIIYCKDGVNGKKPTEPTSCDIGQAYRFFTENLTDEPIIEMFINKKLIPEIMNLAGFVKYCNYPVIGFFIDPKFNKIYGEFIINDNTEINMIEFVCKDLKLQLKCTSY